MSPWPKENIPASSAAAVPPPAPTSSEPGNVRRAFEAGRQALAAKRYGEAEQRFLALTQSNPDLSGAHANLAIAYLQAGKHAQAVAALERAAQLSPDQAPIHNQLGIAYRQNGQFAKAREAYNRALAIDPKYAAATLNLGILNDLYLRDGARALELYERYLTLVPAGDDEVRKWIADLKNRLNKQNPAGKKEPS
jgi:Flp pilus assembly protein TadD